MQKASRGREGRGEVEQLKEVLGRRWARCRGRWNGQEVAKVGGEADTASSSSDRQAGVSLQH